MGVDVLPIRTIPLSSESAAASDPAVFHSAFFISIVPNFSPFPAFGVFSFPSFFLLAPFTASAESFSSSATSRETRTLEDLLDMIDLALDRGSGSEILLELIPGEMDLARDENLVFRLPSARLSAGARGSGWATVVAGAFFSASPSSV